MGGLADVATKGMRLAAAVLAAVIGQAGPEVAAGSPAAVVAAVETCLGVVTGSVVLSHSSFRVDLGFRHAVVAAAAAVREEGRARDCLCHSGRFVTW